MSTVLTPVQEPVVSFVIPVRNDAHNLARCLKAILGQPGARPIEIIVADNGSTDPSREVARSLGAIVLRIPDVPVSTLRNRGLGIARANLIAFIDADNEVAAGWLAAALPHFSDPRVGAVGLDYSPPPGGTWVQRVYDGFRNHPATIQPVRWLASGNLVVRRSAALEIDGFDDTLETSEDVDFCTRLKQHGYQILADPRLESAHFGDPRTLVDLFKSELWRGRDSLRLGLRGINSWSELPGLLFPIVALCSIAVGAASVALAWVVGNHLLWWAGVSLLAIVGLSSIRAIRMLRRLRRWNLRILAGLWLVALVYDLARALAPVIRVQHRHAAACRKGGEVAA